MRGIFAALALSCFCPFLCAALHAQNEPIPFIDDPLVPGVVAPGGSGFTLTVNGANFVSGDVVNWNGTPLPTTVVSNIQLTAAVPAANIATPGTIFVTVSNHNGGTSNFVFFEVTTPIATLAFKRTDLTASQIPSLEEPTAITVVDFLSNGTPTLAITNFRCAIELQCVEEHSSISFVEEGLPGALGFAFTGEGPYGIGAADFTGNGGQDLITSNQSTYSILPASYYGTHNDYPGNLSTVLAFGDFNRDGYADFASSSDIFLSNGDGTFAAPVPYGTGEWIAAGDFNGDGKLDLAETGPNSVLILLGNGDGTFQSPVSYPVSGPGVAILAADFNGDGSLDLAVAQSGVVSILLGNGDGTFQPAVDYPAGTSIIALTLGDYNGDGVLDLAALDNLCTDTGCPADGSVNVLLGNGDGSFQSPLDFADGGGTPVSFVTAELAYDGEVGFNGHPGFAVVNDNLFEQNYPFSVSTFVSISSDSVNLLPTISSISPQFVPAGNGAFTLTVNGTNFAANAMVEFAGESQPTTVVSSTQLTAMIPATEVISPGAVAVSVLNPSPGGGASTAATFIVQAPAPQIASLSPPSVVAGGASFALTVIGQNFLDSSVIAINGVAQSTTFVSAQELATTVSASEIANEGSLSIAVTDPVQVGGLSSGAMPLQVLPTNAQPTLGSLSPASAIAGSADFTLTINGGNFTASSIVTFNSATVSSAFVSTTELQAAIPATLIAVAGTPLVTVMNPGGTPSLAISFIVNNSFNVSASASAEQVTAGQAANFTLMVAPVGGTLMNSVTFTTSGLPAGATASFSPGATVSAGSKTTSVTLAIMTTARSGLPFANRPRSLPLPGAPFLFKMIFPLALAIFLWLALATHAALRPARLLLAITLFVAAATWGCGGGPAAGTGSGSPSGGAGVSTGTPTGTYSITVTATSGPSSEVTSLSLTVN